MSIILEVHLTDKRSKYRHFHSTFDKVFDTEKHALQYLKNLNIPDYSVYSFALYDVEGKLIKHCYIDINLFN